ncbi:MAG: glycoside hydrolase family 43 protein [Clostridia bacterium]|nr:glycoside hydrolase family 43 protein [Clostridia bacterium]
MNKYLFCYFTGNLPEEESVHFAVSADGYNFEALNGNKPVIKQTLGKKCCRDPYLFRDEKGIFHIIATDMRCHDGWSNNNSMVVWDSEDLVTWKNERIIDFSQFESTKTANRVWAPEVIFDREKAEYMIYWTHNNSDDDLDTVIWFAYTKDFITLTTEPKVLFRPKSGMCAIDADIIEKDGRYYLFQADGEKEAICYAVSYRASGPYYEPDDNRISVADTALEGNCIYKIIGTDKYVMIADQFKTGGYFMQESTDLIRFTEVDKSRFSLNHLRPRHGSMLHITDEEYQTLVNHYQMVK